MKKIVTKTNIIPKKSSSFEKVVHKAVAGLTEEEIIERNILCSYEEEEEDDSDDEKDKEGDSKEQQGNV